MLILLCPIATLWLWAFVVEPYFVIADEEVKIYSPTWDERLDGLKVGIWGDIHGRGIPFETFRIERQAQKLNSLNPDIIFLTGDYITRSYFGKSMDEDALTAILSKLKAPYGVYAIMGNHDSYYSKHKVRRLLRAANIDVIENSNRKITTPKGDFYVAAIADPVTSSYSYRAAFKKIPKGAPVIFLTHSHDVIREIPDAASVSFAGHTHGGQIRIPFIGPLVTHSIYGRHFSDGLVQYENRLIYVNIGTGMSRYPVRFLCPPTITLAKIYKGMQSKSEPQPKIIKKPALIKDDSKIISPQYEKQSSSIPTAAGNRFDSLGPPKKLF